MRFLTYAGLDPGELAPKLDRVRQAIERDDFRSPDVKKLHGGPYYRARLDDAARLLLQFVEFQGTRACLALEVLPGHAYDRSRFLRGAPVDESRLEPASEPARVEATPTRYLHPARSSFHLLDKPLSFDDAQDFALRHRPPLVVVGSAGSGKTALLLQKLREQPGRVLYVTESAWLAQSSRALYLAHGWDPGEQEPDFLSLSQLVESVEIPAGRPVTFRDFRGWFDRHRARLKFTDPHRCFEELRGVITADPSGLLGLDAYLALGVRQSIYPPEQRAEVHALLPVWQHWLSESGLHEPNLVAHACLSKMTPRYDFAVVDEAQDLTPVQLSLVLASLRSPTQVVLGGDANQVVHPNFFSWAKVKSLFWQGAGLDESRDVALLRVSYRNSEPVTRTANAVLKLKHARFGSVDRESTTLMEPIPGVEGEVRGLSAGSPAVEALAARVRGSAQVAVLVLRDEHKDEARQRFRTPLVFTVQEAKGLEYEHVVLHRLVCAEPRAFAELADGVSDADLAKEALEYRRAKDKGDRTLEAYKYFVNALYVSLTRAVRSVWLVEDDPGHPLLRRLGVPFDDGAVAADVRPSSTEEWQREASRLEAHGKLEQAEAIRTSVLRTQAVPWQVLESAKLEALTRVALDPRCVSSKTRQQLLDYACFQEEPPLATALEDAGFTPARAYGEQRLAVARRAVHAYEARNVKPVLEQVERYGIEFRSPANLTPLMLAAYAGNLSLVEALLARGARVDARDHLGRLPVQWAIRRAYEDPGFARGTFGAVYDVLAPPSLDVQVRGRLVPLGRESGEYFVFLVLMAELGSCYVGVEGRARGWTSARVIRGSFPHFPEVVVRAHRRKRAYVNQVLARSELQSTYPSSRQLWIRELQGHYIPNPWLQLRVTTPAGDLWRPVLEVLDVARFERPLLPRAAGHLGKYLELGRESPGLGVASG